MKIKEFQKIYKINDWSCPHHGLTFNTKEEFKKHIAEDVEYAKNRSTEIEIAKKHLKSRTLTEYEAGLLFNTCELGGIDRETRDYVHKTLWKDADRQWELDERQRKGEFWKWYYWDGEYVIVPFHNK